MREVVRAAYSKWVPIIGREPTAMTTDFNRAIREHGIALAIIAGEVTGLIEKWLQADHR